MTTPKRKTTPPQGELANVLAVLKANTTLLAFIFGLCFVAALLVLAIWFPNPTAFQYTVFRITLALAAAGIAGVIPGMIRLKMQPGAMLMIHAGGALAVFVIVYLLAPAALPPEQEQFAPPSPPPKETQEKRVKPLHPLRISNVDAVENGVHIFKFTPPEAVHIARISNIGNVPLYVSLIGFPEQYFYTNFMHEELIIQGHTDRDIYVVLTCNLPAQDEYIFQLNDSAGGTKRMAIRLNKGWDKYLARQIQYIRYKDGQGANTAELYLKAKQLITASGTEKLAAPLKEALTGQLLAAANQPEAAALAYSKAEKEDSQIAERFIVNSSPSVMIALANTYKRESNIDREQYWRNFAGKISPVSKKRKIAVKRREIEVSQLNTDPNIAKYKVQKEHSEYQTDSVFLNTSPVFSSESKVDNWRYIDNLDGTISDTQTGLMWKRCSEGQAEINCEEGKVKKYQWNDAVQRFKNVEYADYKDWRLPTIDELKTLVYCSNGVKDKDNGKCNDGSEKPTINQQAFPNTPVTIYWSGSPVANYSDFAWCVNFSSVYSYANFRNFDFAVRLVRSGQ
ncbi:MAG: DUF1566 domain-containing protein [Candidatus Electrothrix gigas]